jgi:hypothetical protein
VGRVVSSNEESENDKSLGSYESPSDPCLLIKRKRSSSPHDKDYVPEEEIYEYYEVNVLINFYSCSIVHDPLHSFLKVV